MADTLHPINVLTEELRNEDVQARLKSITKLSTIALALGPERTRNDLLPFIMETVYDEDEVLLALAEQLGGFVALVGGDKFAYMLFPPLESLACIEETVVRDKAVEVIARVAKHLPVDHLEQHFLPVVRRLTQGDWFTNRVSACGLYACVYVKFPEPLKDELRRTFRTLAEDDTPMVRRAAATSFKNYCFSIMESNPSSDVIRDTVELLNILAVNDEQDSVRSLSVPALITMVEKNTNDSTLGNLYDVFQELTNDKSWRVRQQIADKYPTLQATLLKKIQGADVENTLVETYCNLVKDVESEVRQKAVVHFGIVCTQFTEKNRKQICTEHMLPILKNLVGDQMSQVKSNLGGALVDCARILGKELANKEILPLVMLQLKDETAEVRMNVISNLTKFDELIGMDSITKQVLPVIIELAQDTKWRVRLAIIENIPVLAKELGREMFDQKLSEIVLTSLSDSVHAIREAGCECIASLVKIFGEEWTSKVVQPKMNELATHGCYLKRLTCLFLMNNFVQKEVEKSEIAVALPLVLQMSNDEVPNVRFNCARTYGRMKPAIDRGCLAAGEVTDMKTRLGQLKGDKDEDVSFYAMESWKILGYSK